MVRLLTTLPCLCRKVRPLGQGIAFSWSSGVNCPEREPCRSVCSLGKVWLIQTSQAILNAGNSMDGKCMDERKLVIKEVNRGVRSGLSCWDSPRG